MALAEFLLAHAAIERWHRSGSRWILTEFHWNTEGEEIDLEIKL